MKLSEVSVKRPVFAAVISLLLVILGLLAASRLPVRELPDVESPVVSIETDYLGASADVVETKITQVIEERVAGLEGITKITSQSIDGRSSINLEFDPDRSVDEAANDVRDRVARVSSSLPPEADPPEVGKVDFGADPIIWLALSSDTMNVLELTDYAERELVDRLSVLPGVARVRMGGARRYAMRVWIDREALAARQLTVADVEAALRRENVQLPAGRLESAQRELTLRTQTGLNTEQDFRELVIGRGEGGYLVRLGEVADVRLAAENERTRRAQQRRSRHQHRRRADLEGEHARGGAGRARGARAHPAGPAAGHAPRGQPRPLGLHRRVDEGGRRGARHRDGLVVLVVIYLFLGNARATLVPAVTIPVSIVAAFIVMAALGFSINTLTLLGLVLAIGLVVDDAIVVLENIYRRMERGEPALIASVDGSREIGFAVVATTMVLVTVFLPMSFLQGNVGKLFREFGFTIAAAVAVLGARGVDAHADDDVEAVRRRRAPLAHGRARRPLLPTALRLVRSRAASRDAAAMAGRRRRRSRATALATVLLRVLPAELAPSEDRGFLQVGLNGPEGASLDYMDRHLRAGRAGRGAPDRDRRRDPVQRPDPGRLRRRGRADERGARVHAARALGRARPLGRPDRAGRARRVEQAARRARVRERARRLGRGPGLAGAGRAAGHRVRRPRRVARPADAAHGARTRASRTSSRTTRSASRSSRSPSTAIAPRTSAFRCRPSRARSRRCSARASSPRSSIATANTTSSCRVASRTARRRPISTTSTCAPIARASWCRCRTSSGSASSAGPMRLNRFDRLRSITVSAALVPGYALGDALRYVEDVVEQEMPPSVKLAYDGQSREFKQSGAQLYWMFVLALVIVFLVLAALFESFLHPFIIITTVPLAIIGALVGLWLYGMSINVFSQIASIMLVGLAAKNGILIVEFANQLRDRGLEYTRGGDRGSGDPPAARADDELLHGVRRAAADARFGRRRRVAQVDRRRRVLRRRDLGAADARRGAGGVRAGGAQHGLAAGRRPAARAAPGQPRARAAGRTGCRFASCDLTV